MLFGFACCFNCAHCLGASSWSSGLHMDEAHKLKPACKSKARGSAQPTSDRDCFGLGGLPARCIALLRWYSGPRGDECGAQAAVNNEARGMLKQKSLHRRNKYGPPPGYSKRPFNTLAAGEGFGAAMKQQSTYCLKGREGPFPM